ncbi:hypothetical protein DOTSEDRAFT_69980 [Dothistroma septosporum NZE10]|uniref:Uncharacterized protein n=1 Tax=Dothistroma septosporum (strain NZE10 / CBS 128990) TaxID=675120 RepID=N1PYZ6_DOTSN|nr:hypothetical protein DOTSEDRAFT_69980 [Dothistroma septosporum NZE10]
MSDGFDCGANIERFLDLARDVDCVTLDTSMREYVARHQKEGVHTAMSAVESDNMISAWQVLS